MQVGLPMSVKSAGTEEPVIEAAMYSISYSQKKERPEDIKECVICNQKESEDGGDLLVTIIRGVGRYNRREEYRHWTCADTAFLLKVNTVSALSGYADLRPRDRRHVKRSLLAKRILPAQPDDPDDDDDDAGSDTSSTFDTRTPNTDSAQTSLSDSGAPPLAASSDPAAAPPTIPAKRGRGRPRTRPLSAEPAPKARKRMRMGRAPVNAPQTMEEVLETLRMEQEKQKMRYKRKGAVVVESDIGQSSPAPPEEDISPTAGDVVDMSPQADIEMTEGDVADLDADNVSGKGVVAEGSLVKGNGAEGSPTAAKVAKASPVGVADQAEASPVRVVLATAPPSKVVLASPPPRKQPPEDVIMDADAGDTDVVLPEDEDNFDVDVFDPEDDFDKSAGPRSRQSPETTALSAVARARRGRPAKHDAPPEKPEVPVFRLAVPPPPGSQALQRPKSILPPLLPGQQPEKRGRGRPRKTDPPVSKRVKETLPDGKRKGRGKGKKTILRERVMAHMTLGMPLPQELWSEMDLLVSKAEQKKWKVDSYPREPATANFVQGVNVTGSQDGNAATPQDGNITAPQGQGQVADEEDVDVDSMDGDV
ncbi:hypothetical protein HK101_003597 [Irineochytrium annulatum]|nr:hypothetical protein HK101_003597 [Irineochytrium annulatum]